MTKAAKRLLQPARDWIGRYGNSNKYAIARLCVAAKHNERIEVIYQRVLVGEISPHAGMVEAGWRKPRQSKRLLQKPAVRIIIVRTIWDAEAKVWRAEGSNLPGLVTEASTLEELDAKLPGLIADLLEW